MYYHLYQPYCYGQGTYSWSAGLGTTASVSITAANTYTVTVTGANGCTANASTTITAQACGGSGNIFTGDVSCSEFKNGSKETLSNVCYQTTKGLVTIVSNSQPGVFQYYAKVTAPSSAFCIDVKQTRSCNNALTSFLVHNNNHAYLLDNNCNNANFSFHIQTSSPTEQDVFICVLGAKAGNTYVISVQYDVKSIIGSLASNSTLYLYHLIKSIVGGSTIPNSTSSLTATNGCRINNDKDDDISSVRSPVSGDNGIFLTAYPNPFEVTRLPYLLVLLLITTM